MGNVEVNAFQCPAEGRDLGARGPEVVRRRFLLPRLLADELSLYRSLVSAPPGSPSHAAPPAAVR